MRNSNDGPDHHLKCACQITHFGVHTVQNTVFRILIQNAHFELKLKLRTLLSCENSLRGLTQGQKLITCMIIPVKNNSNDKFLARCVSKLESRMLITITNSNSSPEVNSSEVSLKSQCEFRVCMQKQPKHLLGGGAYVTFVFVHTCVYIYEFIPWPPLENSHSKDELQSSLQ